MNIYKIKTTFSKDSKTHERVSFFLTENEAKKEFYSILDRAPQWVCEITPDHFFDHFIVEEDDKLLLVNYSNNVLSNEMAKIALADIIKEATASGTTLDIANALMAPFKVVNSDLHEWESLMEFYTRKLDRTREDLEAEKNAVIREALKSESKRIATAFANVKRIIRKKCEQFDELNHAIDELIDAYRRTK